MFPSNAECYLVFNKADLVTETVNKAAEGIDDETEAQRKRDEVKNRWQQLKKSVEDIARPYLTVPVENEFEICSKGIEYDNEDTNLIEFFNRLIAEKEPTALLPEYNWIQKLVKEK